MTRARAQDAARWRILMPILSHEAMILPAPSTVPEDPDDIPEAPLRGPDERIIDLTTLQGLIALEVETGLRHALDRMEHQALPEEAHIQGLSPQGHTGQLLTRTH